MKGTKYILVILLGFLLAGCAGGYNRTHLNIPSGLSAVQNDPPANSEPDSGEVLDQPELVAGNVDEFDAYMAKMNASNEIRSEEIPSEENNSRPVAPPSAPSQQTKVQVSRPATTINTSALWGEINQLKSRVTLVEERIEASPGVMKGMILSFRPGRTAITNEVKADLEKLITAHNAGKIENIAVGIHTDRGTGSQSRNKALTAERSKNIKAFFQNKGINIGEQALKAEITNRVNGPSLTVIYSVK